MLLFYFINMDLIFISRFLQGSCSFQEKLDVHSGHLYCFRPNSNVAEPGCRKRGSKYGVPEPHRGVRPHREPKPLHYLEELTR